MKLTDYQISALAIARQNVTSGNLTGPYIVTSLIEIIDGFQAEAAESEKEEREAEENPGPLFNNGPTFLAKMFRG